MGETTKWSNIALGRVPLQLPASSMPNVNLPAAAAKHSGPADSLAQRLLNNQRYRTELSLNVADYSYGLQPPVSSSVRKNKSRA